MTDQEIEQLALEMFPNPSHDTHWEREKVRFLRIGFIEGAKAIRDKYEQKMKLIELMNLEQDTRTKTEQR